MAEALNFLISNSCFSGLLDKLQKWQLEYHVISCDENMNRCCEMIEFTAKIQAQLFAILNSVAAEGKHTDGVSAIKTRLLPCLGTCFSTSRPPITSSDASFSLMQDLAEKERKITELTSCNKNDMQWMESQLCSTRLQLDSVKAELDDAHRDLDKTKSKTVTTLLATEDELRTLKDDLRSAHLQIELYKKKLDSYHDYDRQVSMLRDEVSYLSADRLARSSSLSPLARSSTICALSGLRRSSSPIRSEVTPRAQLTSSSRLLRVVSRFSDLYAVERKEAQLQLQQYISDLETVQRIIFIAVVESFKTAKLAYRLFRLRARKTLSAFHFGPESLEDTILDYIVKNQDLYDVQTSVDDVLSAMNLNPQIASNAKANLDIISPLIREACKVAFTMQTLDPPLYLHFASDGEHFISSKYRRSHDSDLSSQCVMYHIWPALMQGNTVRTKGEAVTRGAALWSGPGNSCGVNNVRSRSLSPTRSLIFKDGRSLSPDALSASCL
ncbi:mitochondria-eating protein [Dunckerocampus dactyliophorus]|uniref:mitochondria-eating protein n=1 Tax=Dunckerocampus dactyliophorus TaxID=161453 RepID=UPI0024059237|nr:mitochondria-eating protein [Dunckerocampus dactyliophorus]